MLTKEERLSLERSERAKALHAQGKFGGPQPGSGRPRKKRASELIAEKIADEAELFYDRLITIVRSGNDSNALAAMRDALKIEEQEQVRKDRDKERVEDMARDELLILVAGKIQELAESGAIPSDFIDGTAWEVEDEGPPAISEGTSELEQDPS